MPARKAKTERQSQGTEALKSARSSIQFEATLKEIKQDSEGEWTVRLVVSQTEAPPVLELSKHTLKSLKVYIEPPDKARTFGAELQE